MFGFAILTILDLCNGVSDQEVLMMCTMLTLALSLLSKHIHFAVSLFFNLILIGNVAINLRNCLG